MSTAQKENAFPVNTDTTFRAGITKREYFAAAALQGILANDRFGHDESPFKIAYAAVAMADEVISILNPNQ